MNLLELIKQFFESLFGGKSSKDDDKKGDSSTKPVDKNTNIEPKDTSPSKPKTNMEKTKKLYALIVGINDYQHVTKLGGCVNDAERINAYLKKVTTDSEFEYVPLLLTDDKAKKKSIEDAFLNHLAKAEKEDVAFFYFSGHGAQEKGDAVWKKIEADGSLETIVCYDSRDNNGTPDLADKELRYLIHEVSKKNPHIVVISDSCHSGDNTRSDLVKRRLPNEGEAGENGEIITSRLSNLAPQRSWDKFCFAHKISPTNIANVNEIKDIFPEGRHIQLSACKDRELAYELRGSGVFTSMLLNVLERSNGNISYSDLRQRVRHSVSGKFPQHPQIYASNNDSNELMQTFLGGAAVKEPFYYNVQKNLKTSIGWVLSIGAIHGMPPNAAQAGLKIDIRDTNNKSKILTTATVKNVNPGMTILSIADETKLDANAQYLATIPDLFTNPMRVYIHGDATGKEVLKNQIQKDDEFAFANLEVTNDLILADYLVYADGKEGNYSIGQSTKDLENLDKTYTIENTEGDILTFPYWKILAEKQKGFTGKSADEIIKFLKTASNWHFLRKLENPMTQLKNHGIEVNVNHVPSKDFSKAKSLRFDDGIANAKFDDDSNPPRAYFTIEVTNHSQRTYRVALPALFVGFEVSPNVLPGGVIELNPGQTQKAFGGNAVSILLPDKEDGELNWWIKDFNWHHKSFWLTLIVSTEDFDIADFARTPVALPKAVRSNTRNAKGFDEIDPVNPSLIADWTTEQFEIQIANPFYVQPPEEFA
jgi:hypothetical protein